MTNSVTIMDCPLSEANPSEEGQVDFQFLKKEIGLDQESSEKIISLIKGLILQTRKNVRHHVSYLTNTLIGIAYG